MSIPGTKNIRFMKLGSSIMILILMKLLMRIGKKFTIEKVYSKKKNFYIYKAKRKNMAILNKLFFN